MKKRLTLALDVMGGDFGPNVTVPASLRALDLYPNLKLLLVGNPDSIFPLLREKSDNILKRLTVIPSKSVISSEEKPSKAIRTSYGTSMRIALELTKSKEAEGCISGGNTGALMGLAKLVFKPLDGIDRPALAVVLPNQKYGKIVVLDLGANIKCDSSMLVQFAVMGSVLSEKIVGIKNPRVALLNIGAEESKGLSNIYQASVKLRNISFIHYIGYLEPNELLMGKTDVLVCDGFIGNIMLKTMEGVIKVLLSLIYFQDSQDRLTWLVQKGMEFWIKKYFINKRFTQLNPDKYNGACLVGLRDIVVKSHGAANQVAFIAAIEHAMQAVENQVSNEIASRLMNILHEL